MDEHAQPLEAVKDDLASTERETVYRANLPDEAAVNGFMETYSVGTNTSWIVQKVQKSGERYVDHRAPLLAEISLSGLKITATRCPLSLFFDTERFSEALPSKFE